MKDLEEKPKEWLDLYWIKYMILTVIQTTITLGDNLIECPPCHMIQTKGHILLETPKESKRSRILNSSKYLV